MWELISITMKQIWSNKTLRYVIGAILLLIALVFSWFKITGNYYDKGVADQTAIYKKEQADLKAEYENKLLIADADKLKTNAELVQLKNDYVLLQLQRKQTQTTQKTERDEYAKTDSGKSTSIDPKWMQLYKDSLPH